MRSATLLIIAVLMLTACNIANPCTKTTCPESAECKADKLYRFSCTDEGTCEKQFVKDCGESTGCLDKHTLMYRTCISLDGGSCDTEYHDCRTTDSRYECYEETQGKAKCTIPPEEDTVTYVDDVEEDTEETTKETAPKEEEPQPCTREKAMECSFAQCETNEAGDPVAVYYGCLHNECVPVETSDCKERYGPTAKCEEKHFSGRAVGQCTP